VLLHEHLGKQLLADHGIRVPTGRLVSSATEAGDAAAAIGGPVVVKVQVPAGGRGKAGGVRLVATPTEAQAAADVLLGSTFGGYHVRSLLVEQAVAHDAEHYVAVTDDPLRRTPVLLCAAQGGVEVEELEHASPGSVRQLAVSALIEPDADAVAGLVAKSGITTAADAVVETLLALWRCANRTDAELVEVNPLAVTSDGVPWALDAKCVLDEAALPRHEELTALVAHQTPDHGSGIEAEAAARGFLMVSLDGDIGVVANGAGLTMATLDVVRHYGGAVASCIEIGGDNYTKGAEALDLLMRDGRVRSLLVNLCGAFARTDVMADGLVSALASTERRIPVAVAVAGTGSAEARQLVRDRLGVEPAPTMDHAVRQAVAQARGGRP
jgi:succinyl-CoA synthetase beta subunit